MSVIVMGNGAEQGNESDHEYEREHEHGLDLAWPRCTTCGSLSTERLFAADGTPVAECVYYRCRHCGQLSLVEEKLFLRQTMSVSVSDSMPASTSYASPSPASPSLVWEGWSWTIDNLWSLLADSLVGAFYLPVLLLILFGLSGVILCLHMLGAI